LDRLRESHRIEVQWRSFELRPKDGLPLPPEHKAFILARRPLFEKMAQQSYGLEINSGPFGINSRPALVGAKYAEAHGVGEAYHRRVMRAYWQAGQSIEEVEILQQIAGEIGLAVDEFTMALQDPQYEVAVTQDIRAAWQLGIQGVPALLFEKKYFISGAQPYAVLAEIVERIENGTIEQLD
jgi:predicted DsbA family dithiol-disulfide isomerase